MEIFRSFEISGSALMAEKVRVDTVSSNLANIQTTRSAAGGPYRRKTVIFAEKMARLTDASYVYRDRDYSQQSTIFGYNPVPENPRILEVFPYYRGRGVNVAWIYEDPNPPRLEYDPEHPDANEEGYVAYPNIEMAKEMTDLVTASRSYEASSTAINTAKSLYLKALEIGR